MFRPGLRACAKAKLGRAIQVDNHSPVEDARAAMELYLLKRPCPGTAAPFSTSTPVVTAPLPPASAPAPTVVNTWAKIAASANRPPGSDVPKTTASTTQTQPPAATTPAPGQTDWRGGRGASRGRGRRGGRLSCSQPTTPFFFGFGHITFDSETIARHDVPSGPVGAGIRRVRHGSFRLHAASRHPSFGLQIRAIAHAGGPFHLEHEARLSRTLLIGSGMVQRKFPTQVEQTQISIVNNWGMVAAMPLAVEGETEPLTNARD
ncbi:hypothetical protein AC579_8518 [Pseudocercospora musae]|uniref:Uncharacterized protein n=1 Tax=Pseudocercospora musae TaxID=113226 RepID=A0A139IA55_9PEZI|nr:hypothetical protein AC579_8518 [Pseudocercospora musae]